MCILFLFQRNVISSRISKSRGYSDVNFFLNCASPSELATIHPVSVATRHQDCCLVRLPTQTIILLFLPLLIICIYLYFVCSLLPFFFFFFFIFYIIFSSFFSACSSSLLISYYMLLSTIIHSHRRLFQLVTSPSCDPPWHFCLAQRMSHSQRCSLFNDSHFSSKPCGG